MKIEEWSDPALRNPVIQQPNIQQLRRNSSPKRVEPQTWDLSYRKLKQHFDYQFKSPKRIINGQPQMDSTTVDQAETMYKNIDTLWQTLDKSDEEDMDTVGIGKVSYQINENLEEWIIAICIAKDKNRKQEKKEDKLQKIK